MTGNKTRKNPARLTVAAVAIAIAVALAAGVAGPGAMATAAQAATPLARPAQDTCVVEGPEILEASLQACAAPNLKAPGLPQALRVRVTGPQAIKVRWQAPAGPKAKLYSVYAFAGDTGTLVCKVKRLRCTASALDVDKEYTFYVVAENKSGKGAAAMSSAIYLPADASPDGFR